jgi:hypothetical protein
MFELVCAQTLDEDASLATHQVFPVDPEVTRESSSLN